MSPTGTIGGIRPQVTGQGSFNLFNPIRGTPNLFDRSVSWHGAVIIENPEGDRSFKTLGTRITLK